MRLANNQIEVKGETILECLNKCREREEMYEYVTKIHEVTIMKRIFKYNPQVHKNNQFAGMAYQKYYRAIMELKPKEG